MKAILAHPKVKSRLCPKAMLHQMMQVMVPGSTAFEGVSALLPGHMMIIEGKGGHLQARTHRYWDAQFPQDGEHRDGAPAGHQSLSQRQLLTERAT